MACWSLLNFKAWIWSYHSVKTIYWLHAGSWMKYKFVCLPSRPLHNVDPNCRSSIISYHFLFKVTTTLAKPITLPWTCLHFSSLGPLLTQNVPLVYQKPYPSDPILNAAYEKLLLMPLISVTTAPTEPRPLHSTLQTWASFLFSSVYSKLLEGDKCALLISLNLHCRMVPNTKSSSRIISAEKCSRVDILREAVFKLTLKAMNILLSLNNRISVEANGYNNIFLVSSVFFPLFCTKFTLQWLKVPCKMVSWGHIWEERISTNLFLIHYLVRRIWDDMFGSETERKWSFQGRKKQLSKKKKKPCFTKMQSVENLSAECQD